MIRPQDLAVKGTGKLVSDKKEFVLSGQDTQFTQQVSARDVIVLSKTVSFEVTEVISDTQLKLKKELTDEAIELIKNSGTYKVIPHVDQSTLYDKVHERLNTGECIVIFPEGGSHDRSELLPLKGKLYPCYLIKYTNRMMKLDLLSWHLEQWLKTRILILKLFQLD